MGKKGQPLEKDGDLQHDIRSKLLPQIKIDSKNFETIKP